MNKPLAIGLSVTIFCMLFFLGTPICVGCAIYCRVRQRLRNGVITGGTVQETSFMTPHPHDIFSTTYPTQPCAVNATTELGSGGNPPPAYSFSFSKSGALNYNNSTHKSKDAWLCAIYLDTS